MTILLWVATIAFWALSVVAGVVLGAFILWSISVAANRIRRRRA